MISILLFITAIVLFIAFIPFAIIHTAVDLIRVRGFWGNLRDQLLSAAHTVDILANVIFAPFLNAYFLKKGGYAFGQPAETISSALGKNWVQGTLTHVGLGLVGLLNWIDKEHCWKYIQVPFPLPPQKPDEPAFYKVVMFLLGFIGLLFANILLYRLL